MSTVIKTYLSIILILVAVFTFAGIISVVIDVQNARDYHAAVISEIENSNHAEVVINSCVSEASSNGYELIVSNYANSSADATGSEISKVVLKYEYSIDFLGITSEHEVVGYAR